MTLMQDESEKRRRKETQYQQKTVNVMFLSISQAALLRLRSQSFGAMARSLRLLIMLSTTRDANLCSSNDYLQFLFMIMSMKWHLISLKKGPGELIWDHLLPHILNTCHSITAIQRLNWEILEKKAYHRMDLFDKKTQMFVINFCLQIMSLCIKSSAVKTGLMCIDDQNIMFITGWIHCHRIFNAKLVIQFFIIQHGVKPMRGFKSASQPTTWILQHGNTHTAPACSWWYIWHLYIKAPPFNCTGSGWE